MIIVLEGYDGCGKSSVGVALAQELGALLIEFPSDEGTETGPVIRSYLRKEWHVALGDRSSHETVVADDIGALVFQSLQIVNRLERLPDILEAVKAGRHVVLVRYWQSGWVYGQLDGLDGGWLRNIHKSLPQASINILLDVRAETAMARRAARDGDLPPERYEGKLDTAQKVTSLYHQLWLLGEQHWLLGEQHCYPGVWMQVDADGSSLNDVIALVKEQVNTYLYISNTEDTSCG